jgi:DNA-binding CsgD family transcriptional regulator
MSQTFEIQEINWGAVDTFLEALVRIETAADFCKLVVHSGFSNGYIQGCHLYVLDAQSNLSPAVGYGLGYDHLPALFSTWQDNPVARAVRTKRYVFEAGTEETQPILVIPVLKDNFPLGAIALILSPDQSEMVLDETLISVFGKLGVWWLNNLSAAGGSRSGSMGSGTGENLTQRQMQILDRMAQGLINAEIAQELMVSESTVRQETVRIYRELGVPNRAEASKKARMLGLVKRPTPPRMIEELKADLA